jgi:hypothetical protein
VSDSQFGAPLRKVAATLAGASSRRPRSPQLPPTVRERHPRWCVRVPDVFGIVQHGGVYTGGNGKIDTPQPLMYCAAVTQ